MGTTGHQRAHDRELPPEWALTCPQGHVSVKPVDGHFWCPFCHKSDAWPGDGTCDELVDQRTGERLDREALRALELTASEEG